MKFLIWVPNLRRIQDEMPRNAIKPLMLPDGQLRMITQGQELLVDYDEKTLAEVGFKDSQIVYVSVGASRMKKKGEGLETPSILPPPRREHIPTLLLLGPEYFETLFKLMHTLSTVPVKPGVSISTVCQKYYEFLEYLSMSSSLSCSNNSITLELKSYHDVYGIYLLYCRQIPLCWKVFKNWANPTKRVKRN